MNFVKLSVIFLIFSITGTAILFSEVGYANLQLILTFHPEISNYNLFCKRFYKKTGAQDLTQYVKKRKQAEKHFMGKIKEANIKNKLLKKDIDLILKKIDATKRFKIKELMECKDEYYFKLKGVKKYDFVQVNFSNKDYEKNAELKIKVPDKAISAKNIDEKLRAKLFKVYSKKVLEINSNFRKKIKTFLKSIDVLNKKIEANYDIAYSIMFMTSKESREKIKSIHKEINEIVADIAKENNLSAVFNNSLTFTEDLLKIDPYASISISDILKQTEKIEEEYNAMILHLGESGVFSEKSLLKRKQLMENNDKPVTESEQDDLMPEQAYLISYDSWITDMDDWCRKNIENFRNLDSNSQFIIGGGKNITFDVLDILFDKYNMKMELKEDILEFIKGKYK